jgi:hypothetical protein
MHVVSDLQKSDVDKEFEIYNETHPDADLHVPKQPVINDFYKPSNKQKYYEILIVTVTTIIIGCYTP